jgi:hypothetical protein
MEIDIETTPESNQPVFGLMRNYRMECRNSVRVFAGIGQSMTFGGLQVLD